MSVESNEDPRAAFVAQQLERKRRRRKLVDTHGPEAGNKRFQTEVALLSEVVVFFDTPPSQRGPMAIFQADITARARDAGVTGAFGRGKVLYSDLLASRHRGQKAERGGGGRYGTDPHSALGDSSHRRAGI